MLNADKGAASGLDGSKLHIGIVQARFNEGITNALAKACREELQALGVQRGMQKGAQRAWWDRS